MKPDPTVASLISVSQLFMTARSDGGAEVAAWPRNSFVHRPGISRVATRIFVLVLPPAHMRIRHLGEHPSYGGPAVVVLETKEESVVYLAFVIRYL